MLSRVGGHEDSHPRVFSNQEFSDINCTRVALVGRGSLDFKVCTVTDVASFLVQLGGVGLSGVGDVNASISYSSSVGGANR